ncbi:unnamed protein product [Rotaria sp. Silwood1]|nr:unnamed protein product [Rotaria sp. Silwood1]CAF0841621.1 unnamed protein product [Rotaria sp. Silwood1]CAF1018246.1 unnamed protein product [Rotaria sp. Silwood1]CAF3341528.1 unnamed protein product [Rotaria sp. Silwood1]CAF3363905.1 unnamed protein product [Rotaria sp. Silwood1]
MDINHRLHDVEQSSTVYIHQAEKFHAEATHLSSLLEKSFIEAEQFINNRMQILASQSIETNQHLENEQVLLLAIRSKLDTTLTKLTQCHQEAIRLQSNTDSRFRLMINTAKGRLEQVERLKTKMIRYENSLELASPVCEDTNRILSKTDNTTKRKFQDELKRVTEQLKKVIDLGKETRNETQILHGQYDTDVNRHMATLMRHDKTEREQMSILIEHKQSLLREIDWINEQKRIIDNFISKMAPTLDKCLCEGPSITNTNRTVQ